jgi:hypothetical protein
MAPAIKREAASSETATVVQGFTASFSIKNRSPSVFLRFLLQATEANGVCCLDLLASPLLVAAHSIGHSTPVQSFPGWMETAR